MPVLLMTTVDVMMEGVRQSTLKTTFAALWRMTVLVGRPMSAGSKASADQTHTANARTRDVTTESLYLSLSPITEST